MKKLLFYRHIDICWFHVFVIVSNITHSCAKMTLQAYIDRRMHADDYPKYRRARGMCLGKETWITVDIGYRTSEWAADGGVEDWSATHSSHNAWRRISRGPRIVAGSSRGAVTRWNARVNLLMRERGQLEEGRRERERKRDTHTRKVGRPRDARRVQRRRSVDGASHERRTVVATPV